MDDRELSARTDLLTLRALAKLAVTVAEATMKEMGVSDGLISEKLRAEALFNLYEGAIQLATRLGSWDEALAQTRLGCLVEHEDATLRQACQLLVWQTNHLYA